MQMRSPLAGLPEFKKPSRLHIPAGEWDDQTALEALEFVESIGYYLDPWQQYLTGLSLLERPDMHWLAAEFAYLVSRQNGKGGILTARSITDLFFVQQYDQWGEKKPTLVVHTAHKFNTANEAFLRLKTVIEGSADLSRMVKIIRDGSGQQGVELMNGNRLRYIARSTGGTGRGWSIDTLLIDESQELPDYNVTALWSTQSAMPNPQRILTGTVPEARDNSDYWTRTRDKGRKGKSRNSTWAEYGPDEKHYPQLSRKVDTALELDPDLSITIEVNPAIGYRLNMDSITSEAESLSPEAYLRERLSYWPDDATSKMILSNWPSLHDPESQPLDPVVLAVEVSQDRSQSAILAVSPRIEGPLFHVEVVDYRPGVDWVTDRLVELQADHQVQVTIVDIGGPAGPLVTELEEYGVRFYAPQSAEIAQACAMAYDLVSQSKVRWLAHPALTRAVKAAKWRALGRGGRAWDRFVNEDISPLMALSMGLWAVVTGTRPVEEKTERVASPSFAVYGFN